MRARAVTASTDDEIIEIGSVLDYDFKKFNILLYARNLFIIDGTTF
jgi:hypothetical protein